MSPPMTTDTDPADLDPVPRRQGAPSNPVIAASTATLAALLTRPLAPGLHVVATPIGNLADVTLRALATLATADRIFCEDTRHSLRLLDHFGINRPLSPYHDHNADAVRPSIVRALGEGGRFALISDAGTPLISDPGYKLVRDVLTAGHRVWTVPGASAVLAALTVAGLPTDAFRFGGFLPPKAGARASRLATLICSDETIILYEAPTRVADTVAEIARLAPDRLVAVARELTKLHETVLRGPAATVAAGLAGTELKGECVVLIAPAPEGVVSDAALVAALTIALRDVPLSAAVRAVTAETGAPRKRVYDLALGLKAAGDARQEIGDD